MNKFEQLREMIEELDESLGIWGDIIGGIALFGILFAILVMVP